MIIPGFSRYDITEDGIVTNVKNGRVLKHRIQTLNGKHKYAMVCLTLDNGEQRSYSVLRLLAMTYLEMPSKHARAVAKDKDYTNTKLSNVEWLEPSTVAKCLWDDGKIVRKPRTTKCCSEESCTMLYETLQLHNEPVSMTYLSDLLQVPYSVVRYSMQALIWSGKAHKTKHGFEVIR